MRKCPPSELYGRYPLIDRHGTMFGGEDENGLWFGTPDMPVTIHRSPDDPPTKNWTRYLPGPIWVIDAWLGSERFLCYIRGPKRRVRDYALGMGLKKFDMERHVEF